MPSATALASAGRLPEISRRESDDDYVGVVARLNARWRVIECKDKIQWIVQVAKRTGHGAQWRGASFLRSREGLLRAVRDLAGPVDADALAILQALPARFPEGVRP